MEKTDMKHHQLPGLLALCLLAAAHAPAEVRYVDVNSARPTTPYTNWANAATNIQDAVNAAAAGDQILVTNGTYRPVSVGQTLLLRSVNGPQFTLIDGAGFGRCVLLANGTVLSGFTLTNGLDLSQAGGGGVAFSGLPSDAVVSNCVITHCLAHYGGAAGSARSAGIYPPVGGTLVNCTIISNSATGNPFFYFPLDAGGGVDSCRLLNCTLIGNLASGPSVSAGGGAYASILQNCILVSNRAGGGSTGGGAASSALIHCTLVGNSADMGAGTYSCWLTNCVVYYNGETNHAADNFVAYSCTTPLPVSGVGNITNAPLFINLAAGNLHLQPNSPCIDAATNLSGIITNDLDGRPRPADGDGNGVAAFDMGAYEHYALLVRQDSANPVAPYGTWATAATNIQDAVDAALLGVGDEILVTNGVYRTGGKPLLGRVAAEEPLTLRSVNGPQSTVIDGGRMVRCVYLGHGTSLTGFTLTNGVALDSGGGVAFSGLFSDAVVSNCVIVGNSAQSGGGAGSAIQTGGYMPVGGTLNHCILSGNSATGFQQGNPTIGIGGGAESCTLNDCTLVGNSAAYGGGGASASSLLNCTVAGNYGPEGGGARWSTLVNCIVSSNYGGATFSGTLVNCTMTGNSPGGAYSGFLENCIVYDNSGGPNHIGATLNYCCTTPLPQGGIGNITNAPLFIDQAAGNLRLQSNSPCLNSGTNADAVGSTDLDGRVRIVGGTVDMGAYEYQPNVSGAFIAWLQQYGLATDASADYADSDGDSLDNWQEWIAGTVPTDASSALRLLAPASGVSGLTVTWQSVTNRTYFLERATHLGATPPPPVVISNLVGQAGTTSYTDTNATGPGPFFYRVGVQP